MKNTDAIAARAHIFINATTIPHINNRRAGNKRTHIVDRIRQTRTENAGTRETNDGGGTK
ncbi:hypothetical protein [Limnospira sp. Paracas R14]|uniref:hypothetical protein n=1 Tax=Limnospira sp. Paracas R14 TaxID=2981108 RepID=UPI0028E0E8B3|nr:hypothetical protein [Limnospira sp. Paracas R14]